MVKVKDLSFCYPSSKGYVLDGVSFEVAKGSYVAILGHNGSGKSTLSKLIMGVYKPNLGEIVVGTREGGGSVDIGIVFQNPENQFIGSTVEDDIAFGLENRQLPRDKMQEIVREISRKVGMEAYLDWEPQNLSGGQKQRVAIASALSLNPDVIIFDEVTSMLDPIGKRSILSLIRQIRREEGKTLISITHDMEEAVSADWVVVLTKGKVLAQGKPRDVLNNPDIIAKAGLDKPFIYKVSEQIEGIGATYDVETLLDRLGKVCG